MSSIDQEYEQDVQRAKEWFKQPRFRDVQRSFGPEDVAALQGGAPEVPGSYAASTKLWDTLEKFQETNSFSLTYGCLDPLQMAAMAEAGSAHELTLTGDKAECHPFSSIYVSGWQTASHAATFPGPDDASYSYDTVPNVAKQLFRAQQFHARKQREARSRMTSEEKKANPPVDYARPIIADADTGHGGPISVMKLTQLFIEAGASGIHLEDQRAGSKKCGHMAGKVLVSTQEHIMRLNAARLQADVSRVPLLLVARSDAEAGKLIDSNVDIRDHPFILGCTNPDLPHLNRHLAAVAAKGESVQAAKEKWEAAAGLKTYKQAVADAIQAEGKFSDEEKTNKLAKWADFNKFRYEGLALDEAVAFAKELGVDPYFDWEKPRSPEGYFQCEAGDDMGAARCVYFAVHSDLLWMETKKPNLKQAKILSTFVREQLAKQFGADFAKRQKFAYNLSPSFNWDAAGMSDKEIGEFNVELGKLGFVWQFITLAGFHNVGLQTTLFSREFAKTHMLGYVETIQRRERKEKVNFLTHQKWSGAEYMDRQLQCVTGGLSSTTAMQSGNTEAQFK